MKAFLIFVILVAFYFMGYGVGLKEGQAVLTTRLRRETLRRVFPQECRKCQTFQANLHQLDKEEVLIPISKQ